MGAGRTEHGFKPLFTHKPKLKTTLSMTHQDIITKLETIKAGTFFTLDMERPVKMRAIHKLENITKRSTMQAQACDYARRAEVARAVAEGERADPETPEWVERVERVGACRVWVKGEKHYLAMPTGGNRAQSVYLSATGEQVSRDVIAEKALASETKKQEPKPGQVAFKAISFSSITAIR